METLDFTRHGTSADRRAPDTFDLVKSYNLSEAQKEEVVRRQYAQLAMLSSEVVDLTLKAQAEALIDPLTRLYNRRGLTKIIDRFITEEVPFGLIMFDIDHFKQVNDTYGHLAGDDVLMQLPLLVYDVIREPGQIDLVARPTGEKNDPNITRHGGEEFVVVLPGVVDSSVLAKIAERIRVKVENAKFNVRLASGEGVVSLTVSGGGVLCLDNDSLDDVLGKADELLYKAKNSGRNKFIVAE